MPTHTVLISIGRNIGPFPADSETWERFKRSLDRHVNDYLPTVIGRYNGIGLWEGEEEDSYALLILIEGRHLSGLRSTLAYLASAHGQDSIGCTVHDAGIGPSYVVADS